MGLSRGRKIGLVCLGLAGVALGVDRAFLMPGAAAAGMPVADGVDTVGGETSGSATRPSASARLVPVRDVLAAAADRAGYDPQTLPGDAFDASELFGKPLVAAAPEAVPDEPAEPVAESTPAFRVSSVMPAPGGGAAIINGASVRVGGVIPGTGWQLVEVNARGVVAGHEGRRVAVVLPDP